MSEVRISGVDMSECRYAVDFKALLQRRGVRLDMKSRGPSQPLSDYLVNGDLNRDLEKPWEYFLDPVSDHIVFKQISKAST